MADTLKIYSIPEEYRPTWESSMIEAITQPTANLTQFATRLTNCTGEYVQMQTIGSTDFARRKQRHEKKVADELMLGRRRIYPVAFGKALKMSKDDFTFKGGLPITLNTLHDALKNAAAPLPDRVFLGVEYDEKLRNCVVASLTDGSPYWNDASDGINTDEHRPMTCPIYPVDHNRYAAVNSIDHIRLKLLGGVKFHQYIRMKLHIPSDQIKKVGQILYSRSFCMMAFDQLLNGLFMVLSGTKPV